MLTEHSMHIMPPPPHIQNNPMLICPFYYACQALFAQSRVLAKSWQSNAVYANMLLFGDFGDYVLKGKLAAVRDLFLII